MTDLDTLRRALRVEQPTGQAVDVDQIMTQGRRLRRRRRLAVGGAVVVCAAAAVSGVLAGTGHPGGSAPIPAQRPASPAHVVRERPPSYPAPSWTAAPTPSPASPLAPRATTTPDSLASPLPTPSRSGARAAPRGTAPA